MTEDVYQDHTNFQNIQKIDSSSLGFPQGAPAASERSVSTIHEHREQERNKAENQNAKSILAIDVQNLCKSFNHKQVVCNINLQVKTGEIFGFLGPNGSGKTTTIRMLCGLLRPDSGVGHCLGYNIQTDLLEIKKQVGYMTQRFSLYRDLTVKENLNFIAQIYAMSNSKERVQKSIEKLGFAHDQVNQLAGTLSGGWQQRLALAAALLHEPKLLLLDEPTAGVDPRARRDFWNTIHALSVTEKITTLVSTHYMDEAERCHRVAYIAYGHLLATGTTEEVVKQSKLFMWTISGKNLHQIMEKLQQDHVQATPFGTQLHLTSRDEAALKNAIAPFQTPEYIWQQAEPTLEDVFIHLVTQAKDMNQ